MKQRQRQRQRQKQKQKQKKVTKRRSTSKRRGTYKMKRQAVSGPRNVRWDFGEVSRASWKGRGIGATADPLSSAFSESRLPMNFFREHHQHHQHHQLHISLLNPRRCPLASGRFCCVCSLLLRNALLELHLLSCRHHPYFEARLGPVSLFAPGVHW